jgi:hypothetical protein
VQTANFRDDVMYAVAYKMGLDPTLDLPTDLARAYVSFINAWVRRLYPNFDWPEWTLIEQRTPDASHYVDFAQAGKNVIGQVMKVYLVDPSTVQAISDIPFKLNASGIHVGFNHGTNVWIKYIKAAPAYTWAPYSSTATYAKDGLTYDPTSGNCYLSLQNANTGQALSNATWWALVPFPLDLVELVVGGAYADALREDGQTEKANVQEQAVLAELNLQTALQVHQTYDPMTDQSRPAPRYRLPRQLAGAATSGGG